MKKLILALLAACMPVSAHATTWEYISAYAEMDKVGSYDHHFWVTFTRMNTTDYLNQDWCADTTEFDADDITASYNINLRFGTNTSNANNFTVTHGAMFSGSSKEMFVDVEGGCPSSYNFVEVQFATIANLREALVIWIEDDGEDYPETMQLYLGKVTIAPGTTLTIDGECDEGDVAFNCGMVLMGAVDLPSTNYVWVAPIEEINGTPSGCTCGSARECCTVEKANHHHTLPVQPNEPVATKPSTWSATKALFR